MEQPGPRRERVWRHHLLRGSERLRQGFAGAAIPQQAVPTLTAPVNDSPSDDLQLSTLQPSLRVTSGTSTATGSRTYEFQVAAAETVSEDPGGKTSWVVSTALQPTTRYWWRARAVQGSTTGPWSAATRFRSKVQGYMRNGETVGASANVTFVDNGARFNAFESLITYALTQPLPPANSR